MSMRNYGVSYYGVVAKVTELNLQAIKDFFEISDEDWEYEDFESGNCCEELFKGEVTIIPRNAIGNDLEGDFMPLLDSVNDIEIDAMDDDWVLFEVTQYPRLCGAAYANEEEFIETMQKLYGKFIKDEAAFDWKQRTVHLLGSIWG